MRAPLLALVALLAAALPAPAQPSTAPLDFSGVDAFWPVYDALVRDQEPGAAQWDALFATPGYAALEARERRRAGLERAMRAALMPSRGGERDSLVRAGGFVGRATRHLAGIPAARDSIVAFRATLLASGVLGAARRAVSAYLPRGLTDSVAPPPVALVLFLDDGRGYPSLVVADLLRLARAGADTAYFAHEFYHFYRRRIAAPAAPIAARDSGLVELLAYPAEEGVADQLDKRRWATASDADFDAMMRRPGAPAYAPGYRDAYRHAPDLLARVSTTIERAASRPDSANVIARAARDSLPDAGRALGAYMASAIDALAGRAALVRASADPIRFWLAYDDAARRSGRPRLTPAARATVRRLAR